MFTLTVYFFEIIKFFFAVCFCDAAQSWQLGLQDPASPVFEGMIFFNNYLVFFLIFIGSLVLWLLYITIAYFNTAVHVNKSRIFTGSSILEIVLKVLPATGLLVMASFRNPKYETHCLSEGFGKFFSRDDVNTFQNFLTQGYSIVSEFTISGEFLIYIFFVLILFVLYLLGGYRSYNTKTVELFLSFQKFCCRNQEKIFLITIALAFVLSLNTLSFCEAIIGFMVFAYGFGFSFLVYKLDFPAVPVYLVLMVVAKLCNNTFPWNYVFIGCLVYYVYNVVIMLFPGLELDILVSKFKESQINLAYHMRTEMLYFHVLEQFILFYWGFRWAFPVLFNNMFGAYEYLFGSLMYYGFLSCLIAKTLAMNLFNPLTNRQFQILGFCATCVTGYIAYDVRDMSLEERALSTTRDPENTPDSFRRQFAHYGWTSTTAAGTEVGKAWRDTYNTSPPLIPGTTHINTNEALRIMQSETNPVFVKRIEFHLPRARPTSSGISKSDLLRIIASVLEEDTKISSNPNPQTGQKMAGSPVIKPRLSKAEILDMIASMEEDTKNSYRVGPAFKSKKIGTPWVQPSVTFEDDLRKLRASLLANSPPEDEPELPGKPKP